MKTIILDMYGVIIKDPEGGLMPFINRTFPNLTDYDVYQHWKKANIGGLSSLDFFQKVGFKGDISKIESEYLNSIEIDETFYEAVSVIRNDYRLALLSNDLTEWSTYLRNKFELNDFFDLIIVSGNVKMKKPDPQIFEHILCKLDQPAHDCIFVDDRIMNLAAAQRLGINTVLFNRTNASYDGKMIYSFSELTDLLYQPEPFVYL